MICSLFKRGRFWHAKVRLDSWLCERRLSLETSDKRVATVKLESLLREFEKEAAGIVAPLFVRDAATKPLASLVAAFVADMKARQKSVNTVRIYSGALNKLQAECRWQFLRDVTAPTFCEWRADCGLAPKTVNDYLNVWSRFFRWMRRQRLVQENPFEFVDPVDGRAMQREYRRALTTDEVRALLAAAPYPRRLAYRMALETGLRRSEMRGLRVGDVMFARRDGGSEHPAGLSPQPDGGSQPGAQREGSPPLGAGEGAWGSGPCVRVPASIAKNRKSAVLPLSPEFAAELRAFVPTDAAPFAPVFAGIVPEVETMRRDLARAGIAFEDALGRRVDLHSLRKTYGTALVLTGASPRVVMEAMRHSDLKLTLRTYTDAMHLQGPVAAAVAKLPWNCSGSAMNQVG